ncbi:MAG: urease accessory protein UreD, partial [Cyanobacteria bacterium J06598_3]
MVTNAAVVENLQESKHSLKKQSAQHQLALGVGCDAAGKTILSHRYMAYPLSVSPIFRSEENGTAASLERAYLYRMNTSPGLLAGDRISTSLQLAEGAQLYLADQAATKVHTMPEVTTQATVTYDITVGDRATLEFLPEPLILFAESALSQTTDIVISPAGGLSWGEIILPGRLARGEVYAFRECWSRLRVKSPEGKLWFSETMKLTGQANAQENTFVQSPLFASGPVLGTLILILPEAIATSENLKTLSAGIDALADKELADKELAEGGGLNLASSVLPGGRGLFVRAMAETTRDMQAGFKAAANCVRSL